VFSGVPRPLPVHVGEGNVGPGHRLRLRRHDYKTMVPPQQ
jgi:hypothetical protein